MPDGEGGRPFAVKRAKGLVAASYAPSLSPMARRVLTTLLHHMNLQTGACFPSEERMAALMDVDVRQVSRGKRDLKKAGLVTWTRGENAYYKIDFERLFDLIAEAEARAHRPNDLGKGRSRKQDKSVRLQQVKNVRFKQDRLRERPGNFGGQQDESVRSNRTFQALTTGQNCPPNLKEPQSEPQNRTSEGEHSERGRVKRASRWDTPGIDLDDDVPFD